ncbi:MAG: GIY-YIG nuclease family protein [Pseudomonadota bacterium]
MGLEWNYTSGDFAEVELATRRALAQYRNGAKIIKVGRTNSPERRYKEHQSDRTRARAKPWKRMIVLHECSSLHEVKLAEGKLIKWLRAKGYDWAPAKSKSLGNQRGPEAVYDGEEYFVYVLLDSYGEPVKEPEWLYSTGHLKDVAPNLKQALAVYGRKNKHIKVGRTNDPGRRWREHQAERASANDAWERMVVVYATSSFSYAAQCEKLLIDYADEAGFDAEPWNDIRGSDKPLPSTNFIYVLVD